MDSTATGEALIELVSQDLSTVETLTDLLSRERKALQERDFKQLGPLSNQKQDQIGLLEKNNQQRVAIFSQCHQESNQENALARVLAALPSQRAKELKALNTQFEKALAECKEKNAINGQIIASSLENNQELLNILKGRNTDSQLYSDKGVMSKNNGGDIDSQV